MPLFVPPPVLPREVGRPRSHVTADGATLRFTIVSVERDDGARLQTSVLRYEVETADGVEQIERPWTLHWHTQEGFRQLVGDAGLLTGGVLAPDGSPAAPDATEVAFWLTPDPAFDVRTSTRDRLPAGAQALAAGMLGLDQAIFGERPKVEIVAEADADGLDLGDVDLDDDDPSRSRLSIDPDHR